MQSSQFILVLLSFAVVLSHWVVGASSETVHGDQPLAE